MTTVPAYRVPAPAPFPARQADAYGAAPPVNRAVRWAFLLFVASLAFEVPERSIPFEVPTIMASLLLALAVLSPRASFYRVPRPLVWLTGYLLAFVAAVALHGAESPSRTTELFLLIVQVMLVFWVAYNLLTHESIARAAWWTFGLACVIGAALPLVGIGRTAAPVYTGGERLSAFGQNPNHRALILAAGLLVLVGLTQRRARGDQPESTWARLLAWALIGIVALGLVHTGSRVGLLAAGAGLLVFAFSGSTLGRRLQHAVVVFLVIGGLIWVSERSEVMRNRLRRNQEVEALSGRERIFPVAWAMFQERPGLGWGPINNQYEIALRIGERKRPSRDAHNVLLELLTTTGLLGAVPFLVGVALCLRGAWRAQRGSQGPLPLALAAAVLIAGASANLTVSKILWLVLAYGLAAGYLARRSRRHRVPV